MVEVKSSSKWLVRSKPVFYDVSGSKWLVRLKPVSGSNYQTLIGKFRHSELMSWSVDPSVFFRCVWFRGKKSKWCRI